VPPINSASTRERQLVADLYAESQTNIYEYLVTLGCAPDTAQEITQEAFLRLYMVLRAGKAIEHPKAWVYRVAHNLACDAAKCTSQETVLSDALVARLSGRDKGAEHALLECERREGFQAAFQNLSKQQRLCLELRADGLRYREIAAALGIRTSTVGRFLGRAMSRLRKWEQDRMEQGSI
jgi:RNA polymerase sigma-70 factor (ECF subfamily)